jgi:hypothetical protein
MIKQLKNLVYEKGKEKINEPTGYYKYRVVTELKIIKNLNIEPDILCLEKLVSISNRENIPFKVNQEEVKSSLVCYLLGISKTNPVETGLVFSLKEDFRERDLFEVDEFAEEVFHKKMAETIDNDFLAQLMSLRENR